MLHIKVINYEVIKYKLISAYNFLNNKEINPNPSILTFKRSINPSRTLLFDTLTRSSLLFRKIDINTFIDKDFDISEFKDINEYGIRLKELTLLEIEEWNNLLTTPAVSLYENNFSSLEKYDLDTLKKYAVFCKLSGFYDLDISEVNLTVNDNKLTISVNEDNLVYCGSVEIKTW